MLCRPALAAATEATSAKAAEASTSAEHVAKHGEYIVHGETAGTAESSESAFAARTVEAELIVLLSLLRVMQHVVSLGRFLELFLGFLVARISVRVILYGDFPICFLYFVLRGILAHSKNFIIISFCHNLI